jgi:predicted phage terminase large subunit-like protein
MAEPVIIRPQPGPQEDFLATRADICFYGGAAGGGKSFATILDPLRHVENPEFRGVIFRRETPMITNPGGLWDEAAKVYPLFDAKPNGKELTWTFPSGMEMKLAHLQHEDDIYNWQGSQIAYLAFDEVTHFTQKQFFYMLSRCRSVSGVPAYVRATCNPDPDSWVADFIAWWISPETGLPIPERAGQLRYFIREGDEIHWADTAEELTDTFGDEHMPMSVTFIPAKLTDNRILMEKDPRYKANLLAQDRVDRARLIEGNWKVRLIAGEMFQRSWFDIVDAVPTNIIRRIRYWDRAATKPNEKNKNPDWTVGTKLAIDGYGTIYVEDVVRFRDTPLEVKKKIRATATQDGFSCKIGIEQDPGQAGVAEADDLVRYLHGFIVECYPVTKAKVIRAKPFSAQCQARNVKVVRAPWNGPWFSEFEAFPDEEEKAKDDQVDSGAGGYNAMVKGRSTLDNITKM